MRGSPRLRLRVTTYAQENIENVTQRDTADGSSSTGLSALWQHISKGVALLPLLGVALLAPSAAHAAWRHASAPAPEALSIGMVSNEELAGLHEARGYQYPVWQRLQWLGGLEDSAFDEEVVANGPERDLPRAVQDVVSPAWHQVQWLLQHDGQSAESARTRFFAAVMGSAILLALLLRFAVSLTDANSLDQSASRFQSSPAGGGSGGGGPNASGGISPGSARSPTSAGSAAPGIGGGGAAAASAAAAVSMQGGVSRGAEPRNRNRVGPFTSGGSIGGSELNGGFSVTSFVDTPMQPQVVPRPRFDQSGGNSRVVSRPPINRKPRFVKSPSVQPADMKEQPAPASRSSKKDNGVQDAPLQQLSPGNTWSPSPDSSKEEEEPRSTQIQRLSPGRPKQPLSESSSKEEGLQKAPYQQLTPNETGNATASAASIVTTREPVAQSSEPVYSQATPEAMLDSAGSRELRPQGPTHQGVPSSSVPQAAQDPSEELDIAEIGALAAEVASSGGNSIFGDSNSLSDLAKEVAGASGKSALALDPAAEPLSTATEGTSRIKATGASGVSGPTSRTLPLAASDSANTSGAKGSLWDSIWIGGPKRGASDQDTTGKLMTPDVLALPRQLTMGVFAGAFGAFSRFLKPIGNAADSGRNMVVERRGQSLMASCQPVAAPSRGRRSDGSTMAERAVLALKLRQASSAAKVRKPRQGRWPGTDNYDLFQEALETSAAASKDEKYGPLRSVLAAVPPSGAARYDMVGSLLRGTINNSGFRGGSVSGLRSKYDVVWQLLASGRSSGATAKPKFDPVYDLMRAAAMAADWGHSTSQPLGGWGLDIYDPLQFFGDIKAPTVRSKYDPLQAVLAAEAPTGSNKYDMVGQTLAAGLAAEVTPATDGPVVGVIDWLLSVVGGGLGPTDVSRYDPMTHLLAADLPHAPSGDQKYDAFSWLRNATFKPLQSPTGTTVVEGGRARLASEAPGKYDPASPLLGWLSEPVPTADDPLRAFIRRVAQGPQESSDMAIRPAFVYNDSSTGAPIAIPVDYPGEDSAAAGRSRWPWNSRQGGRGVKDTRGSEVVESPLDAQLPASASPSQPRPATTTVAPTRFDAVPDLLKLWSALAASSAQLDPLDAVNVIANRGAGASFFGVAQAFRRLVDDSSMKLRCGAVWDLARTTQGRTSLPPVTVEAARAGDTLVRQLQGNSAYEPLAALLKGRQPKEVVAVLCVLYDLLLSPARPLPQLQPYDQPVGQAA